MSNTESMHFVVDQECSLDEYFKLYYPNGVLRPCAVIEDKTIQIGIVDRNININSKRLMLQEKDYQPIIVYIPKTGEIVKVTQPGKTGLIYFDEQIDVTRFRKHNNYLIDEESVIQDHLYVASVGEINNVGWNVYWAPLQMLGHVRHARMVSASDVVTQDEAQSLASVFKKYV